LIWEWGIFLDQLVDVNLDTPESCLQLIKKIRPFELFAEKVGLLEGEFAPIWAALEEAKNGNSTTLITVLKDLLEQRCKMREEAMKQVNPV
jgi:hypothetical protein